MLKRLRILAGAFGARFGWNWIGFALGLGIVGISLYVLSHLLRDIEPSLVLAAARATPPRSSRDTLKRFRPVRPGPFAFLASSGRS